MQDRQDMDGSKFCQDRNLKKSHGNRAADPEFWIARQSGCMLRPEMTV
jgi:hypothetical protein